MKQALKFIGDNKTKITGTIGVIASIVQLSTDAMDPKTFAVVMASLNGIVMIIGIWNSSNPPEAQ